MALETRLATVEEQLARIRQRLAGEATFLTRHLTHFGKIPGLRSEDWSA